MTVCIRGIRLRVDLEGVRGVDCGPARYKLVGKDNQIVVSDKISKKERDVTIES